MIERMKVVVMRGHIRCGRRRVPRHLGESYKYIWTREIIQGNLSNFAQANLLHGKNDVRCSKEYSKGEENIRHDYYPLWYCEGVKIESNILSGVGLEEVFLFRRFSIALE